MKLIAICLELSFLNRLYLADELKTFIYTHKLNDQVVLKLGWSRGYQIISSMWWSCGLLKNISRTVFDLISGLFAYVILGQKNRPNLRTPPPLFFSFFFLNLLCTLSASIPGARRYFRRSLHVRDR